MAYNKFSNKKKSRFSRTKACTDPKGVGEQGSGHPGKSQVAVVVLRNAGTDPLVWPSVKNIDD